MSRLRRFLACASIRAAKQLFLRMTDELDIHEAEIEEIKAENIRPKKNSQADFYIELVLVLILGILIGYAVKAEAAKRITIGFNDYKMKIVPGQYDINALQAAQADKKDNAATGQDPNLGGVCTNSDTPGGAAGN